MACPATSGRCLTGQGQSICCDGEFNFPELYNFNQVDTERRQCCFLGIENTVGRGCEGTDIFSERGDGLWCGFGCKDCDDTDLDQYEFIDGKRWLMPVPHLRQGTKRRNWDARGMIHDLRSNEYWPIPGRIVYERGTCWDNDGLECFGADACACFGDNTMDPILEHLECGPAGSPLSGLLPDEFFRTGFRWPPNSYEGSTQGGKQWHCRKFGETRIAEGEHNRSMIIVDPTNTGGLTGVTEPMMDPALLSSNACQSDRMADCTGVLATGSPCELFSAYGVCVDACFESIPECEEQCARTHYSAAHGMFDKLRLVPIVDPIDPTAPRNSAHIISRNDDDSMIGGRTAAWKNTILDMIRTHEFPEEGGAERVIKFDRLDHQAQPPDSNAGIGLYMREWIGWRPVLTHYIITPPFVVAAAGRDPILADPVRVGTLVKVPSGSGVGRLRQAGCSFEYSTWITRVKIVCRLILQQYWNPVIEAVYINPLVRLHIIATTTISVHNLERPCVFTSSRDGLPVKLGIQNEWDGSQYILKLTHGGEPMDYGESFMFFDADGRQFIPSPFVEWRGFLGGHSKPTSEDEADGTGTCQTIAERFHATVPGWPTNVDTPGGDEGDDPAGIYGGHVVLDFVQ